MKLGLDLSAADWERCKRMHTIMDNINYRQIMDQYDNQLQRFRALTSDMAALYARKNKDYGNSFADMTAEYGYSYPLIHLEEKLARLKSILLQQGGQSAVKGESARDSLMDLANYAIMTVIEMDKRAHSEAFRGV